MLTLYHTYTVCAIIFCLIVQLFLNYCQNVYFDLQLNIEMRDVTTGDVEGDLIDNFSIPLSSPAPAEPQPIVGTYELATITIGYTLASINNGVCSSSLITTTAEGINVVKW